MLYIPLAANEGLNRDFGFPNPKLSDLGKSDSPVRKLHERITREFSKTQEGFDYCNREIPL
jgi:hypothetical protein